MDEWSGNHWVNGMMDKWINGKKTTFHYSIIPKIPAYPAGRQLSSF